MALDLIPMLISLGSGALGGNIAGGLLKSGMGPLGRSLTGIIGGGGLGAVMGMMGGAGAEVAADAANAAGSLDPMSLLKSVGMGAGGGGILTAILGMVMGKK